MSGPPARLCAEEHQRVLRERILPAFALDTVQAHPSPVAVLLVASAGAPTGRLSYAAHAVLGEHAVRVELDELFLFHPRVAEFRCRSPLTWKQRIRADALAWCEQVISAVMQRRSHLVVDTLSETGIWANTALVEALQASQYKVELLVQGRAGDTAYEPAVQALQWRTGVMVRALR